MTDFDPGDHLITLSRRQRQPDGAWKLVDFKYLETKWRLVWLRTDHPDARITTELVADVDSTATFRAHVALPNGAEATGWAKVSAGNWKDYVTKAETKALGRALAALCYGTQFCEEFEVGEADGALDQLVDSPVERPQQREEPHPPASQPQGEPIATEAQLRQLLITVQRNAGVTRQEAEAALVREYGPLASLTVRRAKEALNAIKNRVASSK